MAVRIPVIIHSSHQASLAKVETVLYCMKCGKELLTIPVGDTMFTQTHGKCDCSWGCCDKALPTNRDHERHLAHKVRD